MPEPYKLKWQFCSWCGSEQRHKPEGAV